MPEFLNRPLVEKDKNMRLIKLTKTFEKEGKTVRYQQVYVVLDNGVKVAVKPVYSNQKNILTAVAERGEN